MDSNIIAIQFHDQSLMAAVIDGVPHVAMKPICENIGLQWEAQLKRIKRHPVLNKGMSMMDIVAEDGKIRGMVTLPIKLLNGWLFGVETNRVNENAKELLISYQEECFDVLANHFQSSSNPLQLPTTPEPLTKLAYQGGLALSDQDIIKTAVKQRAESLPKEKWAGATIKMWSTIKAKYGCPYKQVAPDQTAAILSLIARMDFDDEVLQIPKGEVELLIKDRLAALPPAHPVQSSGNSGQLNNAISIGLNFPDGMRTIQFKFDTTGYNYGRWFMTLSNGVVTIKPIEDNEVYRTFEQWIEYAIKERGYVVLPKQQVLAKLVA